MAWSICLREVQGRSRIARGFDSDHASRGLNHSLSDNFGANTLLELTVVDLACRISKACRRSEASATVDAPLQQLLASVREIPQAELAMDVWERVSFLKDYGELAKEEQKYTSRSDNLSRKGRRQALAWQCGPRTLVRILEAFATAWNPRKCCIWGYSPGYSSLSLVGSSLQHLCLGSFPTRGGCKCVWVLQSLDFLSGLTALKCLELHCSHTCPGAFSGLQYATNLERLKITLSQAELDTLDEDGSVQFAHLLSLRVLNLSYFRPADAIVRALTRGILAQGKQPQLQRLILYNTRATIGCLEDLKLLHNLRLLDVRRTMLRRSDLITLENRGGGLKAMQGCVLAVSMAEAAAFNKFASLPCCCPPDLLKEQPSVMSEWEQTGVLSLVKAQAAIAGWENGSLVNETSPPQRTFRQTRSQLYSLNPSPTALPFQRTDPEGGKDCSSAGPSKSLTATDAASGTVETLNKSTAAVNPKGALPRDPAVLMAEFAGAGEPVSREPASKKRKSDADEILMLEQGIARVEDLPSANPVPASRRNRGAAFVGWEDWLSRSKKK